MRSVALPKDFEEPGALVRSLKAGDAPIQFTEKVCITMLRGVAAASRPYLPERIATGAKSSSVRFPSWQAYEMMSTSDLIRAYMVFRLCQQPWLVRNADKVMMRILRDRSQG